MLFWKHWGIFFFILIYLKHVYILYVHMNTVKNIVKNLDQWKTDSRTQHLRNDKINWLNYIVPFSYVCVQGDGSYWVDPSSVWPLPCVPVTLASQAQSPKALVIASHTSNPGHTRHPIHAQMCREYGWCAVAICQGAVDIWLPELLSVQKLEDLSSHEGKGVQV